jgi:hypothetical protein
MHRSHLQHLQHLQHLPQAVVLVHRSKQNLNQMIL